MFRDQLRTVVSRDDDRRFGTLDLRVTAVASVLAAVVLLLPVEEPTLLRAVVGLPLFLALPGYAVAAALFPASADGTDDRTRALSNVEDRVASTVERVVVAVVGSLVIVGAAGLLANAVVGVHMPAIVAIVVAVTLAATVAAYAQRLRLPASRRYAPLSSLAGPARPGLPTTPTGWFLLVAAAVALVVVAASGVAALGPNGDGVTEFYVGGPSGNGTVAMGEQPTNLTAGETATHYLVVEQRDRAPSNYTVVATLETGENGTGAATELGRYDLAVGETGEAVQSVDVSVGSDATDPRVVYYLYEGAAPQSPDRETAMQYLAVDLSVASST